MIALVVVVVAGTVGAATLGLGGRHEAAAQAKIALHAVSVTRCTLTVSDTAQGQPSFGSAAPMPLQANGTITWLPKPGTVVHEGQPLIRVDDRPVILLYGSLPQYRTLHAPTVTTSTVVSTVPASAERSGSSKATSESTNSAPTTSTVTRVGPTMRGADVSELKTALARLGYGGSHHGDRYTDATADAVKAWQGDLGESRTGVLRLGDVFYTDGPVRVVPGPAGRLGEPMSASALQDTSRTRVIIATVPDTATWARAGASMTFDAGSATATAVIASVGTAGSTSPDGGQDQALVLHVADQSALAKAGNIITLDHVTAHRANVLCVPSLALVALAEGGYGLQRATPGRDTYLAVHTGLFAEGKVEVSGAGMHAGLRVELPVGD